jgi:predicted RecA/RadA family phage recombinase
MKNFYKDGNTLPLVMTADVVSGQLVSIGAFVGVAACSATAGTSVETALVGVFSLPKVAADVIVQGQAVKFVPATGVISAAGTLAAGVAAAAALAGSTTVYVRLTPGLGETVAVSETSAAESGKHGKHVEHDDDAVKHSLGYGKTEPQRVGKH